MKYKLPIFIVVLILLLSLVLTGCGSKSPAAQKPVAPTETEAPVETTEETVPPTIPEDGNPDDVTCSGSYYGSDAAVKDMASSTVATMGDTVLTNRELQLYYWLSVADHCQADHAEKPDLSQGLDTQICTIDSTVNSWQQYFLRNALNAWHTHQALKLQAAEVDMVTEAAYAPYDGNHEKYMTDIPATKYLYGYNPKFSPNDMHQEWLDAIPEFLTTRAADAGLADTAALASALSGGLATEQDLTRLVEDMNYAYTYFVELSYHVEPTAEDIEAYAAQQGIADDGSTRVDLRHILLIPEGAQVAADGTVSCDEAAWEACRDQAQELLDSWSGKNATEGQFATLANQNSADEGSRPSGGLYVNLQKGQLPEELDAWSFDPARQIGDTDIIRTACGWHIVYCSDVVTGQFAAAEAELLRNGVDAIAAGARETYPMEVHYNAILLSDDGTGAASLSDLLYADIAHERYPTIPVYLQQDYTTTMYGNYKIVTNGCGITTFSMITSYFTDEEWTPPELCKLFGRYSLSNGTDIKLFEVEPATMGYFMEYRTFNWAEAMQSIKDGYITVCLQYKGYWTKGGHYLALQNFNEDGLLVVRDSNMFNYGRLHGHKVDAFNPDLIPTNAGFYWIYQKKVVRTPDCVRCGNEEGQRAPEVFFQHDYLCGKCQTATNRRDSFLACPAV